MKIDKLVRYCDSNLKKYASKYVCDKCNHNIDCPGDCGKCIDQVHLSRGDDERQDYDCSYMIMYYVCKYIYAYTSEIEDCLSIIQNEIVNLEHIDMLSIGSGSSPDLYALWRFYKEVNYSKPISYIGYEHNEHWMDINHKTEELFKDTSFRIQYIYEDVFKSFRHKNVLNANILVLQYVLSHIVYNGREYEIENFFSNLVENVILKMESKAFVIINDINHCLARDKFVLLEKIIMSHGKKIRVHKFYYLYGELNGFQKDGVEHHSNHIHYEVDNEINSCYAVRNNCRSIQHIIEVF